MSILVTGSNRGIGLELVRQLAETPEPPKRIFATCRKPDGPKGKALEELAKKHANIHVIQLDVEDQSSVKAAVLAVKSYLGGTGLNLLINNAAKTSKGFQLETVEQQDMLSAYNTNVVGAILVVKAPLTVQESVQGILKVLAGLSSSSTGTFLDWEGNMISW